MRQGMISHTPAPFIERSSDGNLFHNFEAMTGNGYCEYILAPLTNESEETLDDEFNKHWILGFDRLPVEEANQEMQYPCLAVIRRDATEANIPVETTDF